MSQYNKRYEIFTLPNGTKKYVKITPVKYNPGPSGAMGYKWTCSLCGNTHSQIECPIYYYNNVTEYTRDEFINLSRSIDEEEQKALDRLNATCIFHK
jgi:hypothetical protein